MTKDKILIYDDDEEILLLCKTILLKYGYEVVTKIRCENIVADIETVQPNLVLMDLWIPEIGGEKAIDFAKTNESSANTPIILFSANADIEEICTRSGADGYIEKPFDIKSFIQTIERTIAKKDNQ